VVVFDEAHHCDGNHVYVDVLNKIHLMPSDTQPRILGLTASPFAAGNLMEVQYSNWVKVLG
jgi:ERCC4-related helicase